MSRWLMLSIFMLFLFLVSPVRAQKIYYDLGAVGITGSGDNVTGLHDQWGFYARSENLVDLGTDGIFSAGDNFTNVGMLKVGSLLDFLGGAISDDEGLNTNYEITTAWNNLTGVVDNVTSVYGSPGTPGYTEYVTFSYDSGITFTVYIDSTPDFDATYDDVSHTFPNYNSALDGTPILDITINGGTGSILQKDTDNNGYVDYVVTASATLYGEVTKVYQDNFLFFENGDDFYDLLNNGKIILTFVDQNADNFAYNLDDYPPYLRTLADHNGSIDFTVPEPATIVLVGSGLLSVSFLLRRKTRKN